MVTLYTWASEGTAPIFELTSVLDYLWEDELRSYQENQSEEHIFTSLVAVANWINGGVRLTPDD